MGFVGEDFVIIFKGFNSFFFVNIVIIFELENFFLFGIKWNGIFGLVYVIFVKLLSFLEIFFDFLVI